MYNVRVQRAHMIRSSKYSQRIYPVLELHGLSQPFKNWNTVALVYGRNKYLLIWVLTQQTNPTTRTKVKLCFEKFLFSSQFQNQIDEANLIGPESELPLPAYPLVGPHGYCWSGTLGTRACET